MRSFDCTKRRGASVLLKSNAGLKRDRHSSPALRLWESKGEDCDLVPWSGCRATTCVHSSRVERSTDASVRGPNTKRGMSRRPTSPVVKLIP